MAVKKIKKRGTVEELEEKKKTAGYRVASNAYFCLLHGHSSMTFVKLNSRDHDRCEEPGTNSTKNNATLDKITACHKPYTTFATYYFEDGSLKILLNKVQEMSSRDYDGMGCSQMVLRVLSETLGLSLAQIREKLVHLVYDGVYGSADERLNRKGGFSVTKKLEELLNLPEGHITGQHDAAHFLQLCYADIFTSTNGELRIQEAQEKIKEMWQMLAYRDKDRLLYVEFAEKCNLPDLSMKSPSET